jgi:hypothetical protein
MEESMKAALAQLRAKTDRELAVLIRRELQRSLVLAARGRFLDAAQGVTRAKSWLSVVELSGLERARLENLLAGVEAAIEMPATACA